MQSGAQVLQQIGVKSLHKQQTALDAQKAFLNFQTISISDLYASIQIVLLEPPSLP